MIGKLRIALIKENSLSIPKLELQTVVTVSRIKVKIMEELKETVASVFIWSGLKTVLNFLHNYSNFGVYVTVSTKFYILPILKSGSMYLPNQMLPTMQLITYHL